MARKTRIGAVAGVSNGGHAHGVLIETTADSRAQLTVTGGADGRKRHAAALLSLADIDALAAVLADARAALIESAS